MLVAVKIGRLCLAIRCMLTHLQIVILFVSRCLALSPFFMNFGSGIFCLASSVGRKLVLFLVMGRKGKHVHEQSVGSSARAYDYETIRIIPTQKQESSGTGSSAPSGISAPPARSSGKQS